MDSSVLEAFLALMNNVPSGALVGNSDFVTVCTKVLPGPDVRDVESIVLVSNEDPLRNHGLVNKSHNSQPQRRTRCFVITLSSQ